MSSTSSFLVLSYRLLLPPLSCCSRAARSVWDLVSNYFINPRQTWAHPRLKNRECPHPTSLTFFIYSLHASSSFITPLRQQTYTMTYTITRTTSQIKEKRKYLRYQKIHSKTGSRPDRFFLLIGFVLVLEILG